MSGTRRIDWEEAETLVAAAFRAVGVADAAAASTARALVGAEAEGQVGHGFSRIDDYAAQVRSGKVDGRAEPSVTAPRPAGLVIDAAGGFAYPALDLAIAEGTAAAREFGVASMSVQNSHHCGALSRQVEKIAQAGLVGLMVANAPAAIAPHGGHRPLFGTNPIAFAAPRRDAPPLVIDLSLSVVARGKVMNAAKMGRAIPEGWALDASGAPTTDPRAALAGTMLPIGAAKGTALALMVEVLVAALAGANPSTEVASFFTDDGPPSGAGQFLVAFAPPDADGFGDTLERVLGAMSAMEGVRLPGARRADAIAQARTSGLDIPAHYLDLVRDMAAARSPS